MISVYNQSLICDCDDAEMLRPQHFVVVCEHTSMHDDILSSDFLLVINTNLPPILHRFRDIALEIWTNRETAWYELQFVSVSLSVCLSYHNF